MGLEYNYTPKACKDVESDFEGSVRLRGLHFEKKMDLLEELEKEGVSLSDMAAMGDADTVDPMKAIKLMSRFVVKTKELWVSCDIKDKSQDIEMKSYDDVASYPKAHNILLDVAMHIVGGGLGN